MNTETIEIKKENVMAAYNEARKNGYTPLVNTLEALFGKETFKPQNVMERVKTFEDACQELGIDADKWIQDRANLGFEPDVIAYMKLRIIAAALNEGWEPQFTADEYRYFPWFVLYTQKEIDKEDKSHVVYRSHNVANAYGGLAFAGANYGSSNTVVNIGSRLAFKSSELAKYAGEQFIDIWVDYVFKAE